MDKVIYEELKRIAKSKSITYYTSIGKIINLDMGSPADRNKISEILDEINRYERQYKRPMLSAVVIRQDINMPGEGFFECAHEFGERWKCNNLIFWIEKLNEVHRYWQAH